jgi:hypothetical protein
MQQTSTTSCLSEGTDPRRSIPTDWPPLLSQAQYKCDTPTVEPAALDFSGTVSALQTTQLHHQWRVHKYGAQIAEDFRPGSTPQEARDRWSELSQARKRQLEEDTTDEESVCGTNERYTEHNRRDESSVVLHTSRRYSNHLMGSNGTLAGLLGIGRSASTSNTTRVVRQGRVSKPTTIKANKTRAERRPSNTKTHLRGRSYELRSRTAYCTQSRYKLRTTKARQHRSYGSSP